MLVYLCFLELLALTKALPRITPQTPNPIVFLAVFLVIFLAVFPVVFLAVFPVVFLAVFPVVFL